MNEIIYASAAALAQAIRDREVSSEEVVNACLERIEAVNPQLNAVVQLRADQARARAREADAALAHHPRPVSPPGAITATDKCTVLSFQFCNSDKRAIVTLKSYNGCC